MLAAPAQRLRAGLMNLAGYARWVHLLEALYSGWELNCSKRRTIRTGPALLG
ncbi:MAG: hypothetical protein WA628_11140 [Terriglobales bacterium]